MKTFKQLLEQLNSDPRIDKEGFYSAVVPDSESMETLNKFLIRNFGISAPDNIHCTVMYSTKNCDRDLAQKYSKESYTAYPKSFEFWAGHDNDGYFVLKLESDDLSKEHERLKSIGCKPTFEKYSPHITIVTPIEKSKAEPWIEIGNNDLDNKSFKLILTNQYTEDLKQ